MEKNIIHVQNILKQFKISKREAGMKNAIKSFLFGMVFWNFSLAEMFLRGLDHFDKIIKKGEFARILIRPQNLLL